MVAGRRVQFDKLYYRIGEVSRIVGVKPYVLRYWEQEFRLQPKRFEGAQRRYSREDVEKILTIKKLLYDDRFTITGAKKKMQELRRHQGEQLEMELLTEDYKEILREIKERLQEIKEVLD